MPLEEVRCFLGTSDDSRRGPMLLEIFDASRGRPMLLGGLLLVGEVRCF